MKRFNTDRIRQRMREHNERFPHSKGKLLSSPPVRISLPPQTDKENLVPFTNNANALNGPNNTYNEDTKSVKIPQLSINVTMSEADDDERSYTAGMTQNESSRVSDDEDSNTVQSVWAMMEHYQGTSRDSASDEEKLQKEPVRITDNDSYEASYHHSTAESLGSNTTSTAVHNQKIIDGEVKPKMIVEKNGDSTRIHWLEDEDGKIMQSSFDIQEASEIGNNEEMETSDNHAIDLSTVDEDDKCAIFRLDAASYVSDQAVSFGHASHSNGRQGQPTPARVRQEWVDSGDDDDLSTHPDSLLEESMIQSIQMPSKGVSRAAADIPSNLSTYQIDNDSNTQFSIASLAESKSVSEFEASFSSATSAIPTQRLTRPKLQVQTQELDDVYFDRLGELESNLKVQQNNTDHVQSRLKERVIELEQALKVTVATPRGSVVDENPLKTLLNRNQTLVKEVRFADQTCVELSSKISELEMRNERLQKQVSTLEQENKSFQSDMDGKRDKRSKDATIEKLEKELILANESLRTKSIEEENLRYVLCQAVGDLDFNNDAPGLSLASSIMSERDTLIQDHSIDSNNSFQLSRTIQQQIGVLVERAKSSLQTEKMKNEIHDLRSENIELKSELLLDQLRVNTEPKPADTLTEDSNINLQIQKENEFLGRQLGIVQEKLDQTQTKLNDECQKSESFKMHLGRGVEMYKRLIEPLERRLIEVTKCNPKLQDVADIEKELVRIKASIARMKRESERLLTAPTFNIGMISDIDQQQQIVSKIQATISRMGQNYKQLELDAEIMTAGLSERLDGLTATVFHLRSSLLFEKESVSSVGSNRQGKVEEVRDFTRDDGQYCGTSIDFINAAIPVQQYIVEDEDEMHEVMEEVRSPRKHEISISSELDDISRLLNDDMTLESIVKTGSVLTSISNMDLFKESLEAAVKECKRVKERSIKLKDQIESHKLTIQKLEQENGKLSLNASRRSEEFSLVERALEEAKEEIEILRSTTTSSQSEKESLYQQFKNQERQGKITAEENERLTKSIVEVQKQKEAFQVRINKYENSLAQTKKELESAMHSNDQYKKRFDDLQSNVSTKIKKVTEQNEIESVGTRRSLQVALHEKSELKRFHQDALKRLSQEVESKLKLESFVNKLQHSKLQAQSDLEDKDLESKFAYEDMRKERAELKHRLSQSEKEALSLKESYTNLKAKMAKMEEKRRIMEKTEIQKSDLLSKINLMTETRISFVNLIENLGCCEDLIHVMKSKDYNSDTLCPIESTTKEIDCWKCVIPLIGDKIEALYRTIESIPELEVEIKTLNNQIKKTEDQTSRNEKLFDLLRQAEEEMERSTLQIKEMSKAMAVMQRRENEANNDIKLMESELMKLKNESETSEFEKEEDLTKVKQFLLDTSATLEKKESQILEMNSEMNSMRTEIEEATSLLRSKESEEHSLRVNIQSCEKKNSRLREYIRKLTTKCEEWEASYDRQSRAIDRLQEKKARIKEKACNIAGRYRTLVADINKRKKLHQHDREKWSNERSNLNSVHAALEQELEQIAKELA
jgi:chromosome segregation ATPase